MCHDGDEGQISLSFLDFLGEVLEDGHRIDVPILSHGVCPSVQAPMLDLSARAYAFSRAHRLDVVTYQ